MKVALWLLLLGGVAAQQTMDPQTMDPQTTAPPTTAWPTMDPQTTAPPTTAWPSTAWPSTAPPTTAPPTTAWPTMDPQTTAPSTTTPSTTAWATTTWGSASASSGSGSDWLDAGDIGWVSNGELWHFQPPWNWDSPYPPVGTTYRSQWPAREIETRRSFQFAADRGVALVGARAADGHVNCSSRNWCVHLTFHSSYGVLSDLDALVLDSYESAERLHGDSVWSAATEDGPPKAFAPLVLGSFTPEERSVLRNLSDWREQSMARRFNETRVTTWTLFPESDELDVTLSFKQLFTLLPGYPDSSASDANSSDWGSEDHILLRVMAKREGSGATSALLPQVLNFTGSQLFEVDYMSSLEYPADAGADLTAAASAMTLDVVLGRRRFGSAIPWDPARPSDVCAACDRQLMQDPRVAHCLHSHVPEHVFQRIFERTADTRMPWDDGRWTAEDTATPANGIFRLNGVVAACFGLQWLRNGQEDGSGSWASGQGEASTAGTWTSSSSWSTAGSTDGSRWSNDVSAGDWAPISDWQHALALTRQADAGIQCFVDSRCPVGSRNLAQAAGRMIILEHERAMLRVNMMVPNHAFYLWLSLGQTHFSTPVLSSSDPPERLAELIANAVPNASDYQLAVDVRYLNNSEDIRSRSRYNDWLSGFYSSGGSASDLADAASSYFADSDAFSAGSDGSMPDLSPDAGQLKTHSWYDRPMNMPEPVFTVEISFRNVSVVPEVLDVMAVADKPMTDETPANLSWSSRRSDLRFQLAPLNLNAFQYIPPPADLDLSWDSSQDDDQSDFFSPTKPVWNDTTRNTTAADSTWAMDLRCADYYRACDQSTSCRLGVRAFLRDALAPSRFYGLETELQTDSTNANLRRVSVDLGPTLRQSAAFFTADGYKRITGLLQCLSVSNAAVNLDLERFVRRSTTGHILVAEPTQLVFSPAQVTFAVPSMADGRLEDVVVSYRGQQHTFQWPPFSKLEDPFAKFIQKVMSLYDSDTSLWTQNPTMSYSDGGSGSGAGVVVAMNFGWSLFVDELPRVKPASASEFNETSRSQWTMTASALRYSDASFVDSASLLTWPRLSNWLYDLALDPSSAMSQGQLSTDNLPVCQQCAAQYAACSSDVKCLEAMRDLLSTLWHNAQVSTKRTSFDFTWALTERQQSLDPAVFQGIANLFSCLSAAVCPVGVALPADPTAQLVPITLRVIDFFAVAVPKGTALNVTLNADVFFFDATEEGGYELANWLQQLKPNGTVEVKTRLMDDTIRYDVACYSAIDVTPTFTLAENGSTWKMENAGLVGTFQLSSNFVARGQGLSWDLLTSWFGLDPQNSLFTSNVDVFGSRKLCSACSAFWDALAGCENDLDCVTSVREVLVPRLRNATLPVSVHLGIDDSGAAQLHLDSLLLSLTDQTFQTQDGWLRFSQVLRAVADCNCDVSPGQYSSEAEQNVGPTRVQVDEAVVLHVRLYANTELMVWLDGERYTYTPTEMNRPVAEAANAFTSWAKMLLTAEPFLLDVSVRSMTIDETVGTAEIAVNVLGMSDANGFRPLINPRSIRSFLGTVTDTTGAASPPAEVSLTPWNITFQEVGGFPSVDRLLDVLQYGAQAPGTASSSSGSGASDECLECADQRQACFDDAECSSALRDSVLPNLRTMTSWQDAPPYSFDASGQFLGDVFANMSDLNARQKMLALLTCSATSQSTASDESCIQKTSALVTPGVSAKLEITQPSSTFKIQAGDNMLVFYQTSTPWAFSADGDTAAFSDFLQNEVLGGSASSGVSVEVSASASFERNTDRWTYSIRYVGFTGLAIPHLHWDETESEDSTMKFVFSASDPDLATVFEPWATWLDPAAA